MDSAAIAQFSQKMWNDSIVPALTDYIRIPAKSPMFDPDWEENGHIERAVDLVEQWCRENGPAEMTIEVVRLPGRTPVILMEIEGDGEGTVLLYGHLDKQPEMSGWRDGFGPWDPILEEGRLYGRGGADDGYSAFAAVIALRALREHGGRHARAVVLIEASEESGSPDLPAYLDHLDDRIGLVDLVVCLDSGCGDYERLWGTTSLRGMAAGTLRVEVLRDGVHSGDAGGIVPSSFRILRHLLSRVECPETGRVTVMACHTEIPEQRREQADVAAVVLGETVHARFPWSAAAVPHTDDIAQLILARTWSPALEITGMDGIPAIENAGNVLRPITEAKLSFRLPPTADPVAATAAIAEVLTADPPQGALVEFDPESPAGGWNAPPLATWLGDAVEKASQEAWGKPAAWMGEGGTIPFMAMLGQKFPEAQFLITGVLGPEANAHGPNEFLHVPFATRLTGAVARVLQEHASR